MDSEDNLAQHYAKLRAAFPKDVVLRFIIIPVMLLYTTTAGLIYSFVLIELGATCIVTTGKVCTYQAVVICPLLPLPLVIIVYELYLVNRYCRARGLPVDYHRLV